MSSLDCYDKTDRVTPFAGMEKYFGAGLYITAELERRAGEFILSVFAVYRLISDRLEFNVGVIDAPGISKRLDDPQIVRPRLRAGIKVHLGSGYNTFDGLTGVEDRIDRHRDTIAVLSKRLDSLQTETRWNAERIQALSNFPDDSHKKEAAGVMNELSKLRGMYDQEPFNPELVRNTIEGITARKEMFLPYLRVIIVDPETPPRIRTLAVSLTGEMKDAGSSDILMSMLARSDDPALKIEIMIALGKIKELRCRQILGPLRNDPDGGVAFTATEIYRTLFGNDEENKPNAPPQAPLGDDTMPERRLKR
jgi:hypothetical protein